jgi:hypothetical protein
MFGIGNIVHLAISIIEERYFFKKELVKLESCQQVSKE